MTLELYFTYKPYPLYALYEDSYHIFFVLDCNNYIMFGIIISFNLQIFFVCLKSGFSDVEPSPITLIKIIWQNTTLPNINVDTYMFNNDGYIKQQQETCFHYNSCTAIEALSCRYRDLFTVKQMVTFGVFKILGEILRSGWG